MINRIVIHTPRAVGVVVGGIMDDVFKRTDDLPNPGDFAIVNAI